jgi:hypothetical protein
MLTAYMIVPNVIFYRLQPLQPEQEQPPQPPFFFLRIIEIMTETTERATKPRIAISKKFILISVRH